MQVLQDCFLHANGLIVFVSDSSWTSVEDIGSLLSVARSADMPPTPNDRPGPCVHEEEFDDAPWLLQVAGPTATGKVPGGLPERASRGSSGSHDVLAEEDCEVDIECCDCTQDGPNFWTPLPRRSISLLRPGVGPGHREPTAP